MRVAVIRNDLPQPILLADLESVSQRNTSVDPPGQVRYISYPTTASVEALLASATTGAGATITGSDISGSFPLTIDGTNKVVKLKKASADAYTSYTLVEAAYASITTLLAAINVALAGSGIVAFNGGASNVVFESQTFGVSSYLQNDNIAGGSTANTALGIANGSTRTMPAASVILTAAGFPAGTLNVGNTALSTAGATTNSNALKPLLDSGNTTRGVYPLRDLLAPMYADSDVAIDSFLTGMLSGYRSASFNPDPRRVPALTTGAAIGVVEDDGSTAYAATLPTITSATLNSPTSGAVTIAGTGLGGESRQTIVKFTGTITKRLQQRAIELAGGSVSNTAIVIPASLIAGATTTSTSVRVQVRQRISTASALV